MHRVICVVWQHQHTTDTYMDGISPVRQTHVARLDRIQHNQGVTDSMQTDAPITMFTTSWCGFCVRLKAQLNRAGIEVREVDIEADEQSAQFVAGVNGGNHTVPTLLFSDGSTLTNPSIAAVEKHLAEI
jgi:mycoredoxin